MASVGAVGTTPFRTELRAGKHLLLVELEGHAPERRQVEVRPGQLTRLGIAQVHQAKYDEAQATFGQVSGARTAVARMWSAYAETRV